MTENKARESVDESGAPPATDFGTLSISEANQEANQNDEVPKADDGEKVIATALEGTEEDEDSRARWQAVLDAEAELASTPSVQNLNKTSLSLVHYYCNIPNRTGPPNLKHALDLAIQATVYEPQEGDTRSWSFYLHGRFCRLMYLDTHEELWIRQAIQSTQDSILVTSEANYSGDLKKYRYNLSLKYDSLRMMLEALFLRTFTAQTRWDMEAWIEVEKNAGLAVQFTKPCDYDDHLAGEHRLWIQLMTPAPITYNRDGWNSIIKETLTWPSRKRICQQCGANADREEGFDDDEEPTEDMIWEVTHYMARRWVQSRDEEDKDALISHVRKHRNPEWPPEICFYHIADNFRERITDEDKNRAYMICLPSLLIGKALWEEFLTYNEPEDGVSFPDRPSFNRNFLAIQDLMQLLFRIHWLTKSVEDAWRYDDRTLEFTIKKMTYQRWNSQDDYANSWAYDEKTGETRRPTAEEIRYAESRRDDSKMPGMGDGTFHYVCQTSVIDGTTKIHVWTLSFKPTRFQFLEVEGKTIPSKETWISERTSDGRFVLGEPVEGRDDDVLKFLNEYSEKWALGGAGLPGMLHKIGPEVVG